MTYLSHLVLQKSGYNNELIRNGLAAQCPDYQEMLIFQCVQISNLKTSFAIVGLVLIFSLNKAGPELHFKSLENCAEESQDINNFGWSFLE